MARRGTTPLAACLVALLLGPSQAKAFCRTLTVAADADFNAAEKGCFVGTSPEGCCRPGKAGCDGPACRSIGAREGETPANVGVPLFWKNACVGYNIGFPTSRRVSYEQAASAFQEAFTVWSGASCPTEGVGRSRASIDVRDLGPVGCASVQHVSNARNQNVLLFRDDEWAHGPQVLGLTTVKYAPDTGEIFGADMEINTQDMEKIAFDSTAEVTDQEYDFLAVTTHEAGHFLGLGHSDTKGSTMHARYAKGETFQRLLSPDDVNAVCTIYRPDGTRKVLDELKAAGDRCDPTPRGGFTRDCEDAQSNALCAMRTAPGRGVSTAAGWALGMTLGIFAVRRARRRRGNSESEL